MSHGHSTPGKRLGKGNLPCEDQDLSLGHIVPLATYSKVFVSLLLLTALTVAAAMMPVDDEMHVTIALVIATIKAIIVGMFFMHVLYERFLIKCIAIYPIFIFCLMLLGTLGDKIEKEVLSPSNPAATTYIEQGHNVPMGEEHHE